MAKRAIAGSAGGWNCDCNNVEGDDMALTNEQRANVTRRWMKDNGEDCSFEQQALFDAISILDDEWPACQQTLVQALPQGPGTFRTEGTTKQKALSLLYLIDERFRLGVF